jgi:hypothetical protein
MASDMKRRLIQAFLMAVLALTPLMAFAQATVSGSGFQVQNLSDTTAANITVTYYAEGSSAIAGTQNAVVPAGGSLTFLDGTFGTVAMAVGAGFKGSVVISSDQPIVAIVNLVGNNLGASYSGFTGGAQSINLPLIVRGNFGVDTFFNVQNTGASDTTVTVTYTPGLLGTGSSETATIPAGSSKTFSQAGNAALGTTFVGSATVTAGAGGSIAAVVQQEGKGQLLSYDAFTTGSATVGVPLLVSNNFGNLTGLQIQNAGGSATTATVTYAANSVSGAGACGTPPAKPVALAAGASTTLIQAGGDPASGFDPFFATCRYVGGATITSSNGQPLVAIVNQVSTAGNQASAYEGFASDAATATVKAPLLMANNFGLLSGVQVQNVGTGSTSITLAYGPNTVTDSSGGPPCPTPTPATKTIPAGASFTFIQAGGDPANGFDPQFATCRYIGSATITAATGGKIVAIVNQVNGAAAATADTLFTYDGFSQ